MAEDAQNEDAPTAAPVDGGSRDRLWGGRFSGGFADIMERINASIGFDKRLYRQDLAGSRAHCNMLIAQGIIDEADGHAILKGLDAIQAEIEAGGFEFTPAREDIHMHVEARLAELIGDAAGRLHTARSRNDQVATDFRLWVRAALDELDEDLAALMGALVARAGAEADTLMPGFTHLQSAQPVTLGHHLLAYVEMLARDRNRARDCRARMNECPLGAAALAGTSFPVDRWATAKALGFDRPTANSLDSVSARDFAMEYLALAAILSVHLSRLAEEMVIWSSAPFAFIQLSDAFTTGSSIMPQKRNPDAAELVRGKTGRVIGGLNALLVMMKGLALAYSKDMQEDKEPVFETRDTLALTVPAMAGMVGDMTVNREAMAGLAGAGHATATDLADWMVRALGLPFRQAHHATGRIVALADDRGVELADLPLAALREIDPALTEEVVGVLRVADSVASRTSLGGTAPDNVRAEVARWRGLLDAEGGQ